MAGLYSRLAATGIRKNGKSYLPYILTSALMISIFYIITFLSANPMLQSMVGGDGMTMILQLGIVSAIFLFYTNSFLIKRRKKEFGLYNILGLGKGQIAKVLIHETLFVYLLAEIAGLGVGILFSKLAEMLAAKMIRGSLNYSFYVDPIAIIVSLILFAVIFTFILLNSLRQLFFTRPIELLHSESTGEKPPRTNVPAAVIGFILLGFAYFMASVIKDPSMAVGLFFIAVIMVIIATYLLFIAGSVVICRILQKNKRYYYKTKNFVSVSQMVFRMRKNGAGLASICILSTMVLVTLSSTISLYNGIPDMVGDRFPHDITMTVGDTDELHSDEIIELVNGEVEKEDYTPKNTSVTHNMSFYNDMANYLCGIKFDPQEVHFNGEIQPLDEADDNIRALGLELGENDIAVFEEGTKLVTANSTLKFGDLTLNIIPISVVPESVERKNFYASEDYVRMYVRDLDALKNLYKAQAPLIKMCEDALKEAEMYGGHSWGYDYSELKVTYGFDITEDINEVNRVYEILTHSGNFIDQLRKYDLPTGFDTKATIVDDYYGIYGGLLFLGILLGGVFALAAALIMYYKQISEGYEDAARFEILRKVGMTRREIRAAINSQVLKVFFLPLAAAGIHMLFAFPMIANMLNIFDFYNVELFGLVTLIGFAVFGLLYVLFYKITSKTYMGIVGANEKKERK